MCGKLLFTFLIIKNSKLLREKYPRSYNACTIDGQRYNTWPVDNNPRTNSEADDPSNEGADYPQAEFHVVIHRELYSLID
jgi:hypothetical protein